VFNKLYRTRIDSESVILQILLNANHAVRYRKIQGYGLKDSDFDDMPNCSRRIFNHRKKDLLNSYYIRELKQSDGRSTYYQITPLGIIHLCKSVNDLKEIPFTRIFDVLKFYYNKGKPTDEESYIDKLKNSFGVLEKIYGKNWFVKPFYDIIKPIEIENNSIINIRLNYELSRAQRFEVSSINIMGNKISVRADTEIDESEPPPASDFLFNKIIDEKEMYYLISKFIINAFIHHVMCENIIERVILTRLKKNYSGKNRFKKCQEEFLQFPEKILSTADKFNAELLKVVELQRESLKIMRREVRFRFIDWKKTPPRMKTIKNWNEMKDISKFIRLQYPPKIIQ